MQASHRIDRKCVSGRQASCIGHIPPLRRPLPHLAAECHSNPSTASQLCQCTVWQSGRQVLMAAAAALVLTATQPPLAADASPSDLREAQQSACEQPALERNHGQANEGRRFGASLLAELAGLFGGEERDPIEAFTLYGTTFKKFVIEKLQGEKIVARQRGFTVDTCVSSARASEETPSFQFLPAGEKVRASGNAVCKRVEGSELRPTCLGSCEAACEAGLARWEADNELRSGFVLLTKDRTRLMRSCTRECTTDCTRPGKAYDFTIPYRK